MKRIYSVLLFILMPFSALADDYYTGFRIGGGYSSTSLEGYDLGNGRSFEMGVDLTRIVGLSIIHNKFKGDYENRNYSGETKGNTTQFGVDLGYHMDGDNLTLKPYYMMGALKYNYEENFCATNTSLCYFLEDSGISFFGALGFRMQHDVGIYMDFNYKLTEIKGLNTEQLNITGGYRF